MHAVGVGPIAFDRNGGKSMIAYEALGNLGSYAIELMRTVRCFTDEHVVLGRRARNQGIEIARLTGERLHDLAEPPGILECRVPHAAFSRAALARSSSTSTSLT